MKKKKILLQCQGIAYYYMGLAAIYTKYPDRNVDIDVAFSSSKVDMDFKPFTDKIEQSKYVNNVFSIRFVRPYLYDRLASVPKNFGTYLKYRFRYKRDIIKKTKEQLSFYKTKYSEIFFSHEQGSMLITSLKFLYPKAKFIAYGDGAGLISGRKFLITDKKVNDYIFFKEIIPDEIIALTVYMLDDSLDIGEIPISGTDKDTYADLVKNDELIQKEVNDYADGILSKYDNRQITILMTDNLSWYLYNMSEDEQINIYVDIIERYCSDNGVVILKTHPSNDELFIQNIKSRCRKNIEIMEMPKTLKKYPIEIFYKLLKNTENIVTFLSSAKVALKCIYDVDCIDAYDVIQKYPLKNYANIILNAYQNICDRISCWDKRSIIYEENINPKLTEIYEKYTKVSD
ncbi:hypothetical protein IKE67_09465 [bacterium]|nr:hypothetical protein [bacterium]